MEKCNFQKTVIPFEKLDSTYKSRDIHVVMFNTLWYSLHSTYVRIVHAKLLWLHGQVGLFFMQASTFHTKCRYIGIMCWKRLFCPVSSSKRTWELISYTPDQCCWESLVKVDTTYDRISPLPYSPFYKIYAAKFVLESIGEFGGVVLLCQLS